MEFTSENTKGYSPEDLRILNLFYYRRIAKLREEEREDQVRLKHISKQIVREYDFVIKSLYPNHIPGAYHGDCHVGSE
ncbi:hypothetical protein ES707_07548 [subsurface metagenome]